MQQTTSWLEMRADYQAHIRELEESLGKVSESSLSREISSREIDTYLRKKQLRSYIAAYRKAYNQLGLRFGEKPNEWWLEGLDFQERLVFLLRFTHKMSYSEVANVIKDNKPRVEDMFIRSVKRITEHIVTVEYGRD